MRRVLQSRILVLFAVQLCRIRALVPLFFPFSPEPPTNVVTQGPPVSSTPGLSDLPSGSAVQSSSSSLIPSSTITKDQDDDDSDSESEADSVVLADPMDPASEAFSLLERKIVDKYVEVKTEKKVVEKSSFKSAFEQEKPKTSSLRMTMAVETRLAALDEEIATKKASSSSVTVFSPFLKNRDFKFYATKIKPKFEAQTSVLASMAGVLDQARVKAFKKSKVSFKLMELDSVFKSAYHALEVWFYASSSFEILGDCFLDLRAKLPEEHKELAIQYASLLMCIDKAGRHGIGETANIVANLILKKREHIMALANKSVSLSTKRHHFLPDF